MTKSSIVLFSLRLFLYISVIVLIFAHPGITVSFDRIGIIQWFIIIPSMAVLAFIPEQKIKMSNKRIFYLLFIGALSLIAGPSFFSLIQLFAAGLTSFILTNLLFHPPALYARFSKAAALEPFFLAWVCLRLLSLSRSGEEIAGQSITLTQFILVWTAVVFLLHSVIVYLCLYPNSRAKIMREGVVFSLSALAVLVVLLVVLPPDFVRNTVVGNLLSERIPERIRPSDTDRGIPQRGSGRRTLPRDGNGGRSELRGLPEHEWPGRGGGGSGDSRQYMVKIVASKTEPVYMGNVFRGHLDPVEGFILSTQEQINDLANQRFFVTWSNKEPELDLGRETREVFSLSTLHQKYLPYRPVVIDPTILNEDTGPLRYIHQVVSSSHSGDPLQLVNVHTRPYSAREKNRLAHYLEIPLEDDDREAFTGWLNNALRNWQQNRKTIIQNDPYLKEIFSFINPAGESDLITEERSEHIEKIIAILVSFSEYQYNLIYDDDYSIAALKDFLFRSAEGDCVEFSNSLALLGRLAGIPSRVVTGYLAAESLQTMAHLRGLANLRARIPVLQQFAFDDLYMVTNIHSHSWTQFYIPDYGWLDFEATSFALPPEGMGDFNNWDVVIPMLDGNRTFSQVRKFPWRAVGRTALILVIAAIVCAYALRYGREIVLHNSAKYGGRQGARSLYLLLLARLAADGQPIKPASKTAHESYELFPDSAKKQNEHTQTHFKNFADIYSELRWRQFNDSAEMEKRYQNLCQEYRAILSTQKRGIIPSIVRIFSLRGLAYL